MVKMKRAVIRDFLNYIEETFSVDEVEKAKQVISPEDYSDLFAVQSGKWVSMQSLINFNIAMDQLVGRGDLTMIDELALATSERNFVGLYKVFLSLLSPHEFIEKIPKIWQQQLDQGQCQVVWLGKQCAELEVTNWEPPLYHDMLQLPYHARAITIAGGKNVRVTHPKCMARGDDKCIFHYEFDY